jgi:NADH:ubiquinone oxidoreductase subunit H
MIRAVSQSHTLSSVFKVAVSIYLYVWWGLKLARNHDEALDVAFSVLFVVTLTSLMIVQG